MEEKISALFASFAQPHIVLCDSDSEADDLLQLHYLAWNASLLPQEDLNDYLNGITDTVIRHNFETLLKEKISLFSYMDIYLQEVKLIESADGNRLRVRCNDQTDESPLSPMLINAKEHMENTLAILDQLEKDIDGLHQSVTPVSIELSTDFINSTLYVACLNRSNLRWYRLLLNVWKDQQPHSRVKSIIDQRMEILDHIESQIKQILNAVESIAEPDSFSPEKQPTQTQISHAKNINDHVKGIIAQGGDDEMILMTIYDYSDQFKRILDTSTPFQLDQLCTRYPYFYRYAKLVEIISQGIHDGAIDVPKDH